MLDANEPVSMCAHPGQFDRFDAEGYVDVAGKAGFAVKENRLTPDDHVGDLRRVQSTGQLSEEVLIHLRSKLPRRRAST